MRIVYLHQYFNTPAQGGSLRSYYIAKAMVVAGHEVVIITTHNDTKTAFAEIAGIKVHYLPIAYQNGFGFWRRVTAFFYFAQASYRFVQKLPKPDLIYATSTPLTVGLSALWLKKKLKIPYIFEVRDLWPLVPIALGVLRNPFAKWIAQHWEKRIYQHAQKIIALSPAMQAHVQNIVPQKEVVLVPNMADTGIFSPFSALPTKDKKLTIGYFGTIGYANHLPYFIEIARKAHVLGYSIEFWVVGKGAKLVEVQALAEAYQLDNVHFFPHQNTKALLALLQKVDMVYVSFLDNPALCTTSPNKFFEALACGKLCVVNTKGWLEALVEKNDCGFYANPNKPHEFMEKLQPFLESSELLAQYQHNARLLAEKEFSVEVLTKKMLDAVFK